MNDFDEYIRQGEPDKVEKSQIWQTAIGLQQVDGLKPSTYLIEQAKQNIEGDITIDEVKKRIDAYYKTQTARQTDSDDRTEEADRVSANITAILSEKTFTFSPVHLISIHKRLFADVAPEIAGKIRDYNITKSEWALDGKTVLYSPAYELKDALDYDFAQEKTFNYKGLSKTETIRHIAKFISGIWQIHAFGEGNTRTSAVFTIKYLRSFGYDVKNDMFAEHSWYFRNALVRANFRDQTNGIEPTLEYLNLFFDNLLFGEKNELKNRFLHIKYAEMFPANADKSGASVADNVVDVVDNVADNKTLILNLIKDNPKISVKKISEKIGLSHRQCQRIVADLKANGIIEHIGTDNSGYWKIII